MLQQLLKERRMIYYSHVNEDNSVERNQLIGKPLERLFCIAGSGERVMALLDHPNIKNVHVIDNNREALYLTELKIAALRCLPVKEYLSFIGYFSSSKFRFETFRVISTSLSTTCNEFWANRRSIIEEGILTAGHFEQFLQRIRPLLKKIIGPRFYQCFKLPREEWKNFPETRWWLAKSLFSKKNIYRIAGMRDTAFVSYNADPSIIPEAFQKTLDEDKVSQSCLFHLVFQGDLNAMPKKYLPPSLQIPILSKIKIILEQDKIEINYHFGDVHRVLRDIKFEKKERCSYSLSDLLSFENWNYLKDVIKLIATNNKNPSTVIFRAFIQNRLQNEHFDYLNLNYPNVMNLTSLERTKLYQVVCIDSSH